MSQARISKLEKWMTSIEKRLTEIRREITLIGTSPAVYISGQYYTSTLSGGEQISEVKNVPADRLYAIPFLANRNISVDRIATRIAVAQPNSVIRLGIYDDNDGYPNNLLHGTAEFDTSTTGVKEETISLNLDPDVYWLAIFGDNDGLNIQRTIALERGEDSQDGCFPGWLGYDSPFTQNVHPYLYWYKDQAYGLMPDPFPSSLTKHTWSTIHAIFLRMA